MTNELDDKDEFEKIKHREASRKSRLKNLDKARASACESSRRYRLANPEKVKATAKRYRAKHLKEHAEAAKRYKTAHPERVAALKKRCRNSNPNLYNAHSREYYHNNKLKSRARSEVSFEKERNPLFQQPCLVCQDPKSEGHHYLGYNRDHWLHVQWLCSKHHHAIHYGETWL